MKRHSLTSCAAALALASFAWTVQAENLTPKQQANVAARTKEIQTWAAAPAVVSAVKAQNVSLPADYASMNQDKWKGLTVLDPLVRNLTRTPAAELLKSKKSEAVSEAFLSDANGNKVAFLAKTTSWSHKGMPKHDEPMAGKTWTGRPEMDASTGVMQVQIAVPVLDGDKPIGSLVVGLRLSKLN